MKSMKMTKTAAGVFLVGVPLLAANSIACESAEFEQLSVDSPYGVTIASAETVADGAGYCQVEGQIANAENGKSQIRFRLRMPDAESWNGRYLVVGNGGRAGVFQGEERVQSALQLGYATGQTDTGHARQHADDWLLKETASGDFGLNHDAIQDFAHRSIHLTNVVGKHLVESYYSSAPERSYYFGCSTGGRQGLTAMQRYPNDFDGIVAGAPVFSLPRLNLSQLWASQQVAALDAHDHLLTVEQLGLLGDAAVDACDTLDGIADRIIDNPLQCSVDVAALQCAASDSPPACLTEAQVGFVESIYEGPVSSAGERIYPGRMPGSEGTAATGRPGGWSDLLSAECPHETGSSRCALLARAWFQDPSVDVLNRLSIDEPADVAFADSTYYSRVLRADNPDVTPFIQAGGKAIVYHGWADTSVTPVPTIELYEAMDATVSRKRAKPDFDEHVRLFLAPAMGHCRWWRRAKQLCATGARSARHVGDGGCCAGCHRRYSRST